MTDRPQPGAEPSEASPEDVAATGAERIETAEERADAADAEGSEATEDDAGARAMRALLKRSLSRDTENAPDLLAGVQRRIRVRSRGKFFADGWSTTQARVNYALVAVLTLLFVVLAYFVLGPIGIR
jgi:hypothetical protein